MLRRGDWIRSLRADWHLVVRISLRSKEFDQAVNTAARHGMLRASSGGTSMRSSAPRIVQITNNQGSPGSVVRASLIGGQLKSVTELWFSGSGILAQILSPRRDDAIDVAITIAADAAPGPRAIALRAANGELGKSVSDVLFYVLSSSPYTSTQGIGSHLI